MKFMTGILDWINKNTTMILFILYLCVVAIFTWQLKLQHDYYEALISEPVINVYCPGEEE